MKIANNLSLSGGEIWKDIVGYEGLFQVSNLGEVKTLEKVVKVGKNGGIRVIEETIKKKTKTTNGYYKTTLCLFGKKKTVNIHRLVAGVFIENTNNKAEVNHINGIKTDNRIENLEWCTRKENSAHAIRTGLIKHRKRGDICNFTKLQKHEVEAIRKEYIPRIVTQKMLAEKYKVSDSQINKIILRQRW